MCYIHTRKLQPKGSINCKYCNLIGVPLFWCSTNQVRSSHQTLSFPPPHTKGRLRVSYARLTSCINGITNFSSLLLFPSWLGQELSLKEKIEVMMMAVIMMMKLILLIQTPMQKQNSTFLYCNTISLNRALTMQHTLN